MRLGGPQNWYDILENRKISGPCWLSDCRCLYYNLIMWELSSICTLFEMVKYASYPFYPITLHIFFATVKNKLKPSNNSTVYKLLQHLP